MERFLLFVALSGWLAAGQQAAAPASLTGRVVDAATKEGIRKATVYAAADNSTAVQGTVARFSPAPIYSAVTDDNGSYRFATMPPGGYTLRAEKAGYLAKAAARAARIKVAAGEEAKGEDLALSKNGAISGRVTDADGEPVENVNVQAFGKRHVRGSQFQAMTDDRGQFRIARLEYGSYKLLATRVVNTLAVANAPAGGDPLQVDAPTFFPATMDFASAAEVVVGSGEERGGIEIRLAKTTAVRVTGRVSGELPRDMPISVMLQPLTPPGPGTPRGIASAANSRNAISEPDGRFIISNVTPGEYLASANVYRPGGALSGTVRVRVGQQDVDGVALQLQALVRLAGKVTAEGDGKLPFGQVNISIRGAESGMPQGGGGAQVKADGTFLMENVQRARLLVNPIAPRGWYLKAVAVGGQRQPGLEVDLTAGDGPIELIYSNRPGTVSGTVEGESDGGVAMALPDGGAAGPVLTNLYKTAPVLAGRNAFKIEDVPPGNYLVVVCMPGLVDLLGDPAVWERVKGKSASVKVEEGGTVSAAARLITESDFDEK